jgi:hypothetical protein
MTRAQCRAQLGNSIASVNVVAGLPVIALPSCPGMRHKTGFFIGYATAAGRSVLMSVREECYSYGISQLCPAAVRQGGRGKPQPWRPWTAMEIHSYQGSLDPLWNSTAMEGGRGGSAPGRARQAAAMVRVHSYGIPQPWCAFTAMEFPSRCNRTIAWSSPIATLRAGVSSAARRP